MTSSHALHLHQTTPGSPMVLRLSQASDCVHQETLPGATTIAYMPYRQCQILNTLALTLPLLYCTSAHVRSSTVNLFIFERLDPSPHSHGTPTRAPNCRDARGGAKARSQGASVAPSARRHRSEDTPGTHESAHCAPCETLARTTPKGPRRDASSARSATGSRPGCSTSMIGPSTPRNTYPSNQKGSKRRRARGPSSTGILDSRHQEGGP
eukprot:scaffold89075_cov58-Phaeocystis_antarctica.AAC.7